MLKQNLNFPKFEDIRVSTKTFIVMTNLQLHLEKLFEFLPITNCQLPQKARGRKKKNEPKVIDTSHIEAGSILTLRYKGKMRGIEINNRKPSKKTAKWFRNSFTVVLMLQDKRINFKVYSNGMFQITGCKLDSHADECVRYMWKYVKDNTDLYSYKARGFTSPNTPSTAEVKEEAIDNTLEFLVIPAMRNIDFNLGFNIDREKLTRYISMKTEFYSLLETSSGYCGVNVKLPLEQSIENIPIQKFIYNTEKNEFSREMTVYAEYLNTLTEKERLKKLSKKRFTSILIFHLGSCILSSIDETSARTNYYKFTKVIEEGYDEIIEKLEKN